MFDINIGLNFFDTYHNGNRYIAMVDHRDDLSYYPYSISIYFVDGVGRKHLEFERTYESIQSVINKLEHYWKYENIEWKRF